MLDDIDRLILRELQQNARLSSEELGEKVGVSRSSAQRRVQNLRETGAIQREIAVVSPRHVDAVMTFVVEVELERERIDLLDEFRRSVLKLEEVQQCYYVTGHTDFILIVLAKDMASFDAFSRRVFTENPNIRRFHTNVVVDQVKVGLSIPV
ncbi:Lrp/AsnC family transcriptional regulator [Roseibium marinum]|uniref:DNA-binding Lrp family transcriptional regulator n=1 Tax=Roseibium marinum TaxID=281252 RepID=A0A2S3UWM5_9HYPH|nr:Lrp/AsnC family transcriptional regulator [Roseibium marinum]POF32122.1 DNA-binding Lrp family transcriptional regulator [Roseibium marinum]